MFTSGHALGAASRVNTQDKIALTATGIKLKDLKNKFVEKFAVK